MYTGSMLTGLGGEAHVCDAARGFVYYIARTIHLYFSILDCLFLMTNSDSITGRSPSNGWQTGVMCVGCCGGARRSTGATLSRTFGILSL